MSSGSPADNLHQSPHLSRTRTANLLPAHICWWGKEALFMKATVYYSSRISAVSCYVQLLTRVRLFATPRTVAPQSFLPFTISWSLLKLTSIESMMPSNHLILCHPLLLLPSIFPSIGVFSSESALGLRRPKYWSCCELGMSKMEYFISFPDEMLIVIESL